ADRRRAGAIEITDGKAQGRRPRPRRLARDVSYAIADEDEHAEDADDRKGEDEGEPRLARRQDGERDKRQEADRQQREIESFRLLMGRDDITKERRRRRLPRPGERPNGKQRRRQQAVGEREQQRPGRDDQFRWHRQ